MSGGLFGPEALAKLVKETLPAAEESQLAVVGAVDEQGAQVVVGFTSQSGQWNVSGVYRHDWATGNDAAMVKLIYKF